jgi:hypothetical protein
MCYIDGQKNKYSVLNECNRMLKYNINTIHSVEGGEREHGATGLNWATLQQGRGKIQKTGWCNSQERTNIT